jgi:hypothetical protein
VRSLCFIMIHERGRGRYCRHNARRANTAVGIPTPIPIFASAVSPSFGFSSSGGGVVAVAVFEGELVVDVPVDVAIRVCSDVGTKVLYGAYDDVVSSISPDVANIFVPSSFRYIPE